MVKNNIVNSFFKRAVITTIVVSFVSSLFIYQYQHKIFYDSLSKDFSLEAEKYLVKHKTPLSKIDAAKSEELEKDVEFNDGSGAHKGQ